MTWDLITVAVTCGAIALLTVYDIWTLLKRGYPTTVSWTLLLISRRYPIIPFAIGVLVGHVFWSVQIDGGCP